MVAINGPDAFAETMAKALQEFGYPSVTTEMVIDVMKEWVDGKRGGGLPHGVIGMFVEGELNKVEEARRGAIADMMRGA
jgi:hypothetical protein